MGTRPENPSWILVKGSTAEAIRKATIEHSEVARHVVPKVYRVSVFQIDKEHFGVFFDPPIPPYAFTNLIGWLDDANMTPGAKSAVGWLTAPGDGTRYYLAPQRANAGGDTLVGVSADGAAVSVFLPNCSVKRSSKPVTSLPEPPRPTRGVEPIVTFDITVDANESFGNPQFAVK